MPPSTRLDTLWRELTGGDDRRPGQELTQQHEDLKEEVKQEQRRERRKENKNVKLARAQVLNIIREKVRLQPKMVWDMISRADQPLRVPPPEVVWVIHETRKELELIHRPEEVEKIWGNVFTREPKPQKGTTWNETTRKETERRLREIERTLELDTEDQIKEEVAHWDWETLMKRAWGRMNEDATGPA
jgi:hypothetical protein